MRTTCLCCLLLVVCSRLYAQRIPVNKYGLSVITTQQQYQQLIKTDSNQQLVNLEQFIPGIKKDVRYATTQNFTHQQLYTQTTIYLRLPAAKALKAVQTALQKKGYGLLIYDAYRPYHVTETMFRIVPNDLYAADPRKGSGHNRGVAIDLSMVDLKTGKPVAMPTDFDDFTFKAHQNYTPTDPTVTANRKLLRDTMLQHGFKGSRTEWWHYYLPDYKKYPLMDIFF
ncbi:M15 family metallopeptidase [Chitinophaga nivalis]|uniref:D-alanyl-D-alanine dipeptidase n=1 Tax=Chitinophaga nivalis TaxID=2991709 RepID=A0ABT3IRK1_9BACT|nr:M15 family metallopeptidase [Chitinophaga nivalis]MCW3463708.1 M15 family metallopeptidase [Chitinophaga nivalis]MCW3486602.1 M15 family metallopeptidase [Chitinophaga nivalis]